MKRKKQGQEYTEILKSGILVKKKKKKKWKREFAWKTYGQNTDVLMKAKLTKVDRSKLVCVNVRCFCES